MDRHSPGEGTPTKGRQFAGCTVALVTPFRGGEVDEAALRRSVEWQIAQGTPVLSPVGTTGESPTLSHEEHERVIATVVETAAGRAKVLAGTGSNSTAEAIRLTRFAARAGVDGSLQVAPYYNRPNQEGLYRHFAAIAECSDLPLVLYNVPARTGRNIEPETVERLSAVGPIVAVKEASGSLDQVSELIARTNLTILSGDDSLTLPMLSVGAAGVVSVVANLVPRDVIALVEAFKNGDVVEARSATPVFSPFAVISWRWPRTRFPSRRHWPFLAGATEKCGCHFARWTSALEKRSQKSLKNYGLLTEQTS